jgi:predicted nucleic acid-binding protein
MNFSQTNNKIVIDTNILFMAWYNPEGKCAKVLEKANEGKIEIYAPDSVKIKIFRILQEQRLSIREIEDFLSDFEINWTDKIIYERFIDKVKVKHKPDKPVEALAIALDCEILSADKHFKEKINIDKLLSSLDK